MSRFIRPETRTLTLGNGDQLVVRARLSAGEQRASFARMYTANGDGHYRPNPAMLPIGLVLAYLLDWTLTDDHGSRVEIRDLAVDDLQRVLDSLEPESFQEIKTAIETHEAAMSAAREAEKKTAGGTP